jgi:hypothetical protein
MAAERPDGYYFIPCCGDGYGQPVGAGIHGVEDAGLFLIVIVKDGTV